MQASLKSVYKTLSTMGGVISQKKMTEPAYAISKLVRVCVSEQVEELVICAQTI